MKPKRYAISILLLAVIFFAVSLSAYAQRLTIIGWNLESGESRRALDSGGAGSGTQHLSPYDPPESNALQYQPATDRRPMMSNNGDTSSD
jgi:hypothetical protein